MVKASYTSRRGPIQEAACIEIKLTHEEAEYIGTLRHYELAIVSSGVHAHE